MAGLGPAIHVFLPGRKKGVDARNKCGHDGGDHPLRTKSKLEVMQELTTATVALDPITLEVIRYRLVSITNQIDANIKRTAFSPYIYEYNDFAVGLVGAEGQLIAQCTGGMPPFVADSVGMAVRDGLSIYGKARLHHGDVVLCNHAAV